jgi:iron(III) transport system permease protein
VSAGVPAASPAPSGIPGAGARRGRWGALGVLAWAAAGLVALPILSLILLAARGDAEIWPHLIGYVLPSALRDTLLLIAGVGLVAGATGLGAAWVTSQFAFPGRGALSWMLALPLAAPGYLVAYVYADLFSAQGPLPAMFHGVPMRSLPGAIVVLGVTLYPYVYLAARAMFASQSACAIEAARTLGATPWRLFREVGMPLARPAVAAGLALVILETLNDIGASEYLGVRTLTVSIYATWLNRGSLPGAAQIAVAMLAFVAFALWLEAWSRREQRYHLSVRRTRVIARQPLAGWRALAAAGLCALPVLLGAIVPLGVMLVEALRQGGRPLHSPALFAALSVTLLLAGLAALLVVALGALMALAARARRPGASLAARIGGLGYALPGAVLALGLLTPLATLDNALSQAIRALTGERAGLFLIGSGAAIIIAYVIRFLAIGISGAQSGLERVPERVDEAARTLGSGRGEIMRRLHLPLLRASFAASALLVFVDAMKELPATLLLRPLNLDTLATLVYAQASRGSWEDGAAAALLIVVAGLYPVARLARALDRPMMGP